MYREFIKIIFVLVLVLLFTKQLFADGFVCFSYTDPQLAIQIYNVTDPNTGTRVGHAMIISNPSKPYGQRTIARFIKPQSSLVNYGSTYSVSPYQDFLDNLINGEKDIIGHKLQDITSLVVKVDFKYSNPVDNGVFLGGKMILNVYQNEIIPYEYKLICKRYLKN